MPTRDPIYGDFRHDTSLCRECGEPATDTFESGDPKDEPIHLCAKHKAWSENLVKRLETDKELYARLKQAVDEITDN